MSARDAEQPASSLTGRAWALPAHDAMPPGRPGGIHRALRAVSSLRRSRAAAGGARLAADALLLGVGHRHRGDQALRVGVVRAAQDLVAGAGLHELAVVHHRDAVGEDVDDREVVADEQARELQLLLQLLQQLEEARLHRHVQRRGRLVGDEQLAARAPARGRCRRADAGRPTARAGSGCGTTVGSSTWLEQLLDALVEVLALRLAREQDRLADRLADRHAGVQRRSRVLEHDAGPAADREQVLLRSPSRCRCRRR